MSFIEIMHYDKSISRDINGCCNDLELKSIVNKNTQLYSNVASFYSDKPINQLLNEAFKLTNSIDSPWVENKELSVTSKYVDGCRSTSVGDLIVIDNESFITTNNHFIGLD